MVKKLKWADYENVVCNIPIGTVPQQQPRRDSPHMVEWVNSNVPHAPIAPSTENVAYSQPPAQHQPLTYPSAPSVENININKQIMVPSQNSALGINDKNRQNISHIPIKVSSSAQNLSQSEFPELNKYKAKHLDTGQKLGGQDSVERGWQPTANDSHESSRLPKDSSYFRGLFMQDPFFKRGDELHEATKTNAAVRQTHETSPPNKHSSSPRQIAHYVS